MTEPPTSGHIRPGDNQTITIVLSTYNGERYLAAQVDSIRSQSDAGWHLVLHDDGSTDGTVAIITRFAAEDARIEIVPRITDSPSVASTYLRLLDRVETPLFAFADQDDIWQPDKLARARAALAEAGLDDPAKVAMVSCDAQPVDDQLRPVGQTIRRRAGYRSFSDITVARLLISNPIPGHTIVGTRALARLACSALDRPSEELSMHDWWVALCAAAHGHLIGVEQVGVLYRQHDSNVRGAPSGWNERIRNLTRRPLAERNSAIIEPLVANAQLAQRAWPAPLADSHRVVLEAAAACGDPTRDQRRALLRCWRLGTRLRPWPSQVALLGGGGAAEPAEPVRPA